MNLVIVESPTKARKLAGYLDKNDFIIEASVGHIRDLPKSGLGVDTENNFEPTYEVSEDKLEVVKKLKQLAKKAKNIYLATDPDREGEAIAWHLKFLLTENGTKEDDFKRATFNEITKEAVLKAIENPKKLRINLVDAQQARRVVDRLVGYKVSPVLWKKVRRGLSAGRVQSVALRLIVEKEREIEAFKAEEYWELDVALSASGNKISKNIFVEGKPIFDLPEGVFVARVNEIGSKKYEPKQEKDVTDVVKMLEATGTDYTVSTVEKKERHRSSLPPFTTSTLQQNAATRLGYTSKQTMRLAQQLYEEGLITYHRTDSTVLSAQALSMARSFIEKEYGAQYLPEKPRVFATTSKNAQEAHEAIRITNTSLHPSEMLKESKKFTPRHQKLYDLIWRRFVASQMDKAVYDQTSLTVEATNKTQTVKKAILRSAGSVLKFDGWMKLFPASEDRILPDVSEGQKVNFTDLNAAQKFTQPPPRYNDASLVKELEKKGIGRPSTYASIISVIEDRGYVERLDRRFVATTVGMTVSDFLLEHFPTIMDYDFTAEMEEDLDRIARGEKAWRVIVKTFYQPLEKKVLKVEKDAERVQIPVEKTGEECPTCLKNHKAGDLKKSEVGEIVIRSGRFGKFKSCSRFPDCDFTENIVEKVEGVKCPLCHKGHVLVRKTRWGKPFFGCERYPECDWAAWKAPKKGDTVTPQEWAEQQKERAERAKKRGKGKFAKKSETKTTKSASTKTKAKAKKASKK